MYGTIVFINLYNCIICLSADNTFFFKKSILLQVTLSCETCRTVPITFMILDVINNHCPYNCNQECCNSKIQEIHDRIKIIRYKLLMIDVFEHRKKIKHWIEYRFSVEIKQRISTNLCVIIHTFCKYLCCCKQSDNCKRNRNCIAQELPSELNF